jgi:hypothetical protein
MKKILLIGIGVLSVAAVSAQQTSVTPTKSLTVAEANQQNGNKEATYQGKMPYSQFVNEQKAKEQQKAVPAGSGYSNTGLLTSAPAVKPGSPVEKPAGNDLGTPAESKSTKVDPAMVTEKTVQAPTIDAMIAAKLANGNSLDGQQKAVSPATKTVPGGEGVKDMIKEEAPKTKPKPATEVVTTTNPLVSQITGAAVVETKTVPVEKAPVKKD